MTKSKSQKQVVYKTHEYLKGFATLDEKSISLAYSMGLPTNIDSKQFEDLQVQLEPLNISLYWIENYSNNAYSYS